MNTTIKEGSLQEAALDAAEEAANDMERLGSPMTALQVIEMIRSVTRQVALRLVGVQPLPTVVKLDGRTIAGRLARLALATASGVENVRVIRQPKVAKAPKAIKVAKAPKAAKVAKTPKASKVAKDNMARIRNISVEKGRVYLRGMTFTSPTTTQVPAVEPKFSVYNDHIVCLESGESYKMLKRPLMTHHNMTPEQYKAKWGLPAEYPMTAPSHSMIKREEAKAVGLGHRTSEFRKAARQRTGGDKVNA